MLNSYKCPIYNSKQYDGEVPVMQEIWGIRITPSLPLLLSSLQRGVVAHDRVLFIGQIEINCVLILN